MHDQFHVNPTQMLWVKEIIKEATSSSPSLDTLLEEFKSTFAYEPRLILLELVFQILYTKKDVPEHELQIARRIAAYLQISAYDQRTIEAKYKYGHQYTTAPPGRDTVDRHYATLGLQKGASIDEIKRAYRKLSMKYHPDKVRHLGDEFQKISEEKMKEINAAYEYFKKQQ